MFPRRLLILLLVAVVWHCALSQEDDTYTAAEETQLENDNAYENDNEAPADEPEEVPLEGSGAHDFHETTPEAPLFEEDEATTEPVIDDAIACPADHCICSHESDGDSLKLTVDCSSKRLKELPAGIDKRVNILFLQNNELTELPKSISEFQDLEELNVDNNSIVGFAFGSVSELSKLRVLKAANNRLLEFPQELKNGMDLRSLQVLDLGGNDIRETMTAESFAHLESITALTIPVSTPELIVELCQKLGTTLQKVCTNNCDVDTEECSTLTESGLDIPGSIGDELYQNETNEGDVEGEVVETSKPEPNADSDPEIEPSVKAIIPNKLETESNYGVEDNNDVQVTTILDTNTDVTTSNKVLTTTEFSLRSAVSNENYESVNSPISLRSGMVSAGVAELPANSDSTVDNNDNGQANTEGTQSAAVASDSDGNKQSFAESEPSDVDDAKVGATVTKQGGGIDNSVIALIVAGMVVVVAGVTIKKNWSSIKNRFRPRPSAGASAVEDGGAQANGTSPEEVPLQDKSIV